MMMAMTTKPATLESIADALTALTNNMNVRFDEVDERFASMKEYIDDGFSAMDKRFDNLETRVDSLGKEVDVLGQEIASVHQRLDVLIVPTLEDHSRRIKNLELKAA